MSAAGFRFVVEGPPVPCARPRVIRQPGRGVRTIMPARTVDYQRLTRFACAAARPDGWPLDGRYVVTVDVYRARRAGDADNFLKSVLDGCTGVAWADDRGVYDAHVRLHDLAKGGAPRVEVTIEGLAEMPRRESAARDADTDADLW